MSNEIELDISISLQDDEITQDEHLACEASENGDFDYIDPIEQLISEGVDNI